MRMQPPIRRDSRAASPVPRFAGATLLGIALLVGCSTPRGIPMDAQLVAEATVKSSFQAPTDGRLWIYRSPARGARGQLHYSGPIGAGQVLVIDPAMNKATIDGQELEIVLPGGDVWYQAYFQADSSVRKVLAVRPPGRRATDDEDRGFRELAPNEGSPARDQQNQDGTNNGGILDAGTE